MGMLMYHTWLNEQKKKAKADTPAEKSVEKAKETAEPVKKTGGRRKATT